MKMKKNLKRFVSLALMIAMLLGMGSISQASEDDSEVLPTLKEISDEGLKISIDAIDEEIDMRAWPGSGPAAQVSSVQIVDIGFITEEIPERAGNIGIVVKVMGHGRDYAQYDGRTVKHFGYKDIILSGTLVDGWYYFYDCGKPTLGDHRFDIKMVSTNSPYTEKSASATFTIGVQ